MNTGKSLLLATVCLLATSFAACNSDKVAPSEYIKLVQDEKGSFVSVRSVDDYLLENTMLSSEFLAVQYFRRNDIDKGEFEKVKSSFDSLQYFKLRITSPGTGSISAINGYADFDMQQHLLLKAGGQDYKAVYYLPEPFNGIRNEKVVMFGFKKDKNLKPPFEVTLTWQNAQEINFDYKKNFDELPGVKLK